MEKTERSNASGQGWLSSHVMLTGAVIAALTFIVYLPALQNGFVNYDDTGYVYKNPGIQRLDLDFLVSVFTTTTLSNWHPLTMLSYGVDYAIWGLNPMWYHLENNVFHALDTFLVFVLMARLSRFTRQTEGEVKSAGVAAAMVTSVLFGLHPIHVESVAWIAERKDVLSVFFIMLSLLAYVEYAAPAGANRPFYYASSIVLFILALLSKPMAVSLPVVLVILDWYPLGRRGVKYVAEKIPFFALSAASGIITVLVQKKAMASMETLPLSERILTALHSYAFYLYKMTVPVDLLPFYPLPYRTDFFSFGYLSSLALLIIITAACLAMARRHRIFLAAWLYYIVTLAPVSGFIQVGIQATADRYAYLPGLGPSVAVGAFAAYLVQRYGGKRGLCAFLLITFIIGAVLSVLTVRQVRVWKDSVALWTHIINVMEASPEYNKANMLKIGEQEYQYVPRSVLPHFYRGLAFDVRADYNAAIKDYTRVIEMNPDTAKAYVLRGVDYTRLDEFDKALADLNTAISINPKYADAYQDRGLVYRKQGFEDLAQKDFLTADALRQ